MLEQNLQEILRQLKPEDKVLDVGGWFIPIWRADHVVDLLPYKTRGFGGRNTCGLPAERFDEARWTNWDVSSSRPLPFADKTFDFVICSHTLEDIRNPIQACSELIRVGKRGYIEVPSREVESTMGVEHRRYCGWYHHRWLVDVVGDELQFRFKAHTIHSNWRYHFPKRHLKRLSDQDRVSWLFWEDRFRYREIVTIADSQVKRDLEKFVRARQGHPAWRYRLAAVHARLRDAVRSPQREAQRSQSAAFWDAIEEVDSK